MTAARARDGRQANRVAPAAARREDTRVRQTERTVFAATLALVAELGPAAVTIERVAERSGVARSTIYRRWSDVNQLFLDAFDEFTRLSPLSLTGDLVTDLRAFARHYGRELDDPSFFSVMIFLMDASLGSKEYRARYRAIARQRQRRGAAIVRAAVAAGELPPDTDAAALADAIMAPLFQQRAAKHVPVTDADADEAVRSALAALDAGR